jgi:hypothetical protein
VDGRRACQHARLLPAQALALNRSSVAALAAYSAISFLYFGLPVAGHFGRDWVGSGADPQIFVWSLAWWPHAAVHGHSPVVTHAVWPPVGLDLTWVSSIPALATAFAPVTLAAGPVAAYNAASILMPALAAWTAFLLCRELTRSYWPSLAGGYLFGFSSYELGHVQGHLNLTSVFLVPLVALVLVRHVQGSLDGRALVVRLAPLLALQFLLSTELLLTLTLTIAVSSVAAALVVPPSRHRLAALIWPVAAAYLAAAILLSPLLYYVVADFERGALHKPHIYSADLLNLVVPTRLTALSTHWTRTTASAFSANDAENGAFLGLPLLVVVTWYAWQRRARPAARLLVVLLLLAVVAELGPYLRVRGATYAPLLWRPLASLPVIQDVLPGRFAMYAALAAAVIFAYWAAGTSPRWLRVVLGGAAIAATVPALGHAYWHGHPHRPAFFSHGLYRSCLPPNATVLVLPYPTWSGAMLWQAEADFRFRLADAWLSPGIPRGVPDRGVVESLHENYGPRGGGRALLQLARRQGANVIMVDRTQPQPWRNLLAATALPRRTVGGVDLYDVGGTLGSCRSRSGRRGASSTSSTRTSARARRPLDGGAAAARR